jgi:hypothetical protein
MTIGFTLRLEFRRRRAKPPAKRIRAQRSEKLRSSLRIDAQRKSEAIRKGCEVVLPCLRREEIRQVFFGNCVQLFASDVLRSRRSRTSQKNLGRGHVKLCSKRVPFSMSACEAVRVTRIKKNITSLGYNKDNTPHFYAFVLLPNSCSF